MPHCASTWRYKLLSEHVQEDINPARMQDTVSWPPRAPEGPASPRADELVDPVRMTRSVSLSDCHLHLDLPHPRMVQIWGEGKGGRLTPPWVVAAASHSLYDGKVRLCVGKESKHAAVGFWVYVSRVVWVAAAKSPSAAGEETRRSPGEWVARVREGGGRIRIRSWSVFARERERETENNGWTQRPCLGAIWKLQ